MLTVTLFFGTLTFADALRGFEVWKQYLDGSDWNTLNYPGITKPLYSYYVSWWSPGQWMIPALLKAILLIDSIQIIQCLTIFICLTLSLIGYKKLFVRLGFESFIIWFSLICILTNQVFYWHSLMYYGGDLLLLAAFPYFILGILKVRKSLTVRNLLLFGFIVIAGLFLKNTFIVVTACSICFLFFHFDTDNLKERILYILPFGLLFTGIYIGFNYFHLSLGETPGSSHDLEGFSGIKKDLVGYLTYSFGSPFGTFSRYSLILQKMNPMFKDDFTWINILQVLPFLFTLLFLYKTYRKGDTYTHLLLFFALPFFGLFTFFNLQNKAIGYEMRHFAPVVMIFFPGIIRWILSYSSMILAYGLIFSFCLFDLGLYALSVRKIEQTHSYWKDYKLPNEDVELFNFISSWQKANPDGMLIVEEYWQLSYAAFDLDKIVIKKKGRELLVVSGMELEFPDKIKDLNTIKEQHSGLLIILQNKGKLSLSDDLGLKSSQLLKSTSNYKVYLSKPN
jgi:hypothetical protein